MARTSATSIKFPILKDVEYFDIIKDRKTFKTFSGSEINNLTWRELSLLIGKSIPADTYHYTFKQLNNSEIFRGKIRVLGDVRNRLNENENKMTEKIQTELNSIKATLTAAGQNSGISVDMLLSITKQSYETQINFLNNELQRKENLISKLETEIDKLNDELIECDAQIDELKSKTGINQYLELAQTFLNSKIGTAKKIETLKDSNPNDIPERILLILGAVDWSNVPANVIDSIINYLEVFITKLPLKGQ